jgi:hypothetical protein
MEKNRRMTLSISGRKATDSIGIVLQEGISFIDLKKQIKSRVGVDVSQVSF